MDNNVFVVTDYYATYYFIQLFFNNGHLRRSERRQRQNFFCAGEDEVTHREEKAKRKGIQML